ncbi:MAG: pseudouridine synthase [Gammaproteobacteria bacterium]|nr:pseudouridine synthase [Gammaproteobacteria bacterium]
MSEVRLSKLMAARGLCSRREADRFIADGLVKVDGVVVDTLGTRVRESQKITLADDALSRQDALVTVLLNKPMNYVSGLPEDGHESAVMLINRENRQYPSDPVPSRRGLAPAGRLDIDSMGLLVYTADGRVARRLVGADSRVEKEYLVWVRGDFTPERLEHLRGGLSLDDRKLRPVQVEHLEGNRLRMVLTEGRKRQIRRMCELVELKVTRLVRVRIGGVRLGRLPQGKWRLLGPRERF